MQRILHCLALSAIVLSAACASAGRQAAWEKDGANPAGTATSTSAAADLRQQAEAAWQKRDDRKELERAIELWEQAAQQNTSDHDTMVRLSRAYYFLVDGHIALQDGDDVNEAKLTNHQKGVDWGERALLLVDPAFGQKMKAGTEFETAIKEIDKKAIPAAYWYCTNLGRFANAKGLSARLFYKDRVSAAMMRIRELDQPFFHHAADRYLGAFYSALPSIAGKDLDKSRDHFDTAIKNASSYLGNKLLKADFLAVQLDDENLYKQLLQEIIAAPDGDDPDIVPENRAAKRHAEKMLKNVGDRF